MSSKRTIWIVKATYEITVDATKPNTLTEAAAWVAHLQGGSPEPVPDGLEVSVTVAAPKIVNRQEAASE